ncbi:MAG: B12-binding domain-containing radical SAM protein [Endomicrobiales bacterium]|nr:B12-binding domain-containing radical SAM protein [Endomicrobiales bacterium]
MKNKTALVLLPVFWPNLPPIGLATLKGFLARNNCNAHSFDFNNSFFNEADTELKKKWQVSCNTYLEKNIFEIIKNDFSESFKNMIKKLADYDIVGFSCYKSNFTTVKKVSKILKEKNPHIRIIYGGPEIARQYFKLGDKLSEEYRDFPDLLVVGEGELALKDFISGKTEDVKVITFQEIDDLDILPEPDYSDFNFDNYPKKSTISLMYSRGCIRRCSFCSERLLHKKFRIYPIEKMISQIKNLKAKGINSFIFNDSLINGNLESFERLMDEIIKNFGPINWEAQIAIRDDMPERLFQKMKQSGCYNLFIGLESGCDRTLHKMSKGFSTKCAVEFFKKLNKYNLNFGVSLIVGFPGETDDDFKESIDFLIRNKNLIRKVEQLNPFVYYEGTSLDRSKDYKTIKGLIDKTHVFADKIKKEGFKYTNAFINNLVEHNYKQ